MDVSSAQLQLLSALKSDDIGSFQDLLDCPGVSATFRYTGPDDWGTCLEIACRMKDRANFVHLLLNKYKAKPNIHDILPEPIHFAARNGNVGALKHLLRDKRVRVNAEDSLGRTALHHVAKNFSENPNDYEQCLELLLGRADVDINRPNKKNCTAIREAAHFAGRDAVVAMLRLRPLDFDVDSHRSGGKTTRQVILDKFPDLASQLPPSVLHLHMLKELQAGNYENVRKMLDSLEAQRMTVSDNLLNR